MDVLARLFVWKRRLPCWHTMWVRCGTSATCQLSRRHKSGWQHTVSRNSPPERHPVLRSSAMTGMTGTTGSGGFGLASGRLHDKCYGLLDWSWMPGWYADVLRCYPGWTICAHANLNAGARIIKRECSNAFRWRLYVEECLLAWRVELVSFELCH